MEIKVTVKQLGKKYPFLKEKILEIKEIGIYPTLKTLLEAIVEQQVGEYNSKEIESDDEGSVKLPKSNYLPLLTETGKMSFGSIYNRNKPDVFQAQKTTIQAFEDGIFAVFLDDDELSDLSQTVEITSEKTLTFIRLTFLAGSYW